MTVVDLLLPGLLFGLIPGVMLGWIVFCLGEVSIAHPEIAEGRGCRGGACRAAKGEGPRASR